MSLSSYATVAEVQYSRMRESETSCAALRLGRGLITNGWTTGIEMVEMVIGVFGCRGRAFQWRRSEGG